MKLSNEINAVLMIAQRDIIKLMRDKTRLIASLIFPIIFVGVLGNSMDANLGDLLPYNFMEYTFMGVLAMTLFQSTAAGIASLIEDRENDFAQELFVSPISRYSIVIGKILGESGVALIQSVMIILFGLIIGIRFTPQSILLLVPAAVLACLVGGAFGVLLMSQMNNQKSANQIFPFVIFPQYFLAGVFNPIQQLPGWLSVLSRAMPLTYVVDLFRNIFFAGHESIDEIVLFDIYTDLAVSISVFIVLLVIGTYLFTRSEKNK